MNLIDQTIAATVQARTAPIFAHGGDERLSVSAQQEKAFQRLDAYIKDGQRRAKNVVERIMGETPTDRYVRAAGGLRMTTAGALSVGPSVETIAPHAMDQLATRAGMNLRYLHDLQGHQEDWARELVATNVNTLLAHEDPTTKYLVRSVGGRVRGVMSDAYKRMDSRPEVDAMIGAALGAGAVIVNGIYTETRVDLKIVRAKPIEVFPGEWMVFGLDYSNSDYGDGAREYRAFLLRLICLNGAVSTTELRKIHIGKRFDGAEGIASAETLELDARAQASLAQDTVKALLSDAATDSIVGQIRTANAKPLEPARIEGFLKTRVGKGDAEKITEKFASADVVEVPPGQNAWRFSNAISWLARETDDGRKKMDLERLAGEAMAL